MNYKLNQFAVQPAALTHAAVVEDLRNWSALTGHELPYPPQWIASAEASGITVDLLTGELFYGDEPVTAEPNTCAVNAQTYFQDEHSTAATRAAVLGIAEGVPA